MAKLHALGVELQGGFTQVYSADPPGPIGAEFTLRLYYERVLMMRYE